MNTTIRSFLRALPLWALLVLLASPQAATAQSELDTAEAQAFLGNWAVAFQTEMGPFEFGLNITDADGKVAAQMMSELGNIDITTITRSGESLVMSYDMDAQGQIVPVTMNLQPNDAGLRANMDIAGGAFSAMGNATRADN